MKGMKSQILCFSFLALLCMYAAHLALNVKAAMRARIMGTATLPVLDISFGSL